MALRLPADTDLHPRVLVTQACEQLGHAAVAEWCVSLLVDGQPRITVPEPPFIDIAVRKRPGDPTVLPPEFTIAVLTILALFGAIGMIVACPTILDESAITIDLGNSALTGDLTPC